MIWDKCETIRRRQIGQFGSWRKLGGGGDKRLREGVQLYERCRGFSDWSNESGRGISLVRLDARSIDNVVREGRERGEVEWNGESEIK